MDALRAEHVDVVLRHELLGQERLGRAKHHVTRIVDQHVDFAALGHDLLDPHIDRRLGLKVELDRAQAVRERNRDDTGHADTFADHGRRAGADEHERERADEFRKELGCDPIRRRSLLR